MRHKIFEIDVISYNIFNLKGTNKIYFVKLNAI